MLRDCQYNFPVIEEDKFSSYVQVKKDYLTSIDPSYSFLITHPPLPNKYLFLEKAFKSGKPFAMLLPILTMSTIVGSRLFEAYPLVILAFRRNVVFEINERTTHFHMAWFCGNMGEKSTFFNMAYIDSVDETDDEDISFSVSGQDAVEALYFE